MNLKQTLIIALTLSALSLSIWELYWRSQTDHYKAGLEDDRYLWAKERAKVETATAKDIVIIGSSRTGFNFNTHVWEETHGIKPINLSTDGKPPGPFLDDIVHNTSFNGTIVIGITPVFWFDKAKNPWWNGAQKWVDHYHDETYAQKLGYFFSKPLQRHLVMLTSSELKFYNDLDLKSLINRISIPGRIEEERMLYNFSYHDEDRNLIMFPAMIDEPGFAEKIQYVWSGFLPYLPEYDVVKDDMPEVFEYYRKVIDIFKARGGKIIFIRHKSEEEWNKNTKRMLPRDKVYDPFMKMIHCPSYHFEDYEFMSEYTLPDWSHMYYTDALKYTKDMVKKLIEDGHLQSYKN